MVGEAVGEEEKAVAAEEGEEVGEEGMAMEEATVLVKVVEEEEEGEVEKTVVTEEEKVEQAMVEAEAAVEEEEEEEEAAVEEVEGEEVEGEEEEVVVAVEEVEGEEEEVAVVVEAEKGKTSKQPSWSSYPGMGAMQQTAGGSAFSYLYGPQTPVQPVLAQTPVLIQTPYGYLLTNTGAAGQSPLASNPYLYGTQQDAAAATAASATGADGLKNLIAYYIAAANAQKTAVMKQKLKLASKPGLSFTPAQILAYIKAIKAAKAAAPTESPAPVTIAPPTPTEEADLVAKIKNIIATHEAAGTKTAEDSSHVRPRNSKYYGIFLFLVCGRAPTWSRVARNLKQAIALKIPTAKPNPAWPLIQKELESLGIPITTKAPAVQDAGEISATPNPFEEFLKKYLSTASDPAAPPPPPPNPFSKFASLWPALSKDLISSGIPISPAASLTPEAWIQLKGAFLGPVGKAKASAVGKPFWASFMAPKADPATDTSGQPFWMSFIKPKPAAKAIPPKTSFIPPVSPFVPGPISNLIPLKTALIPPVPPFAAYYMPPMSYGAQMSDPPAASSKLLPPFMAASMVTKQQPGAPASTAPANPWLELMKTYMVSAPTPAPTPNPFFEYLKTAGETPASGGLPWWTSFIKPKAPPAAAPLNPYMAAAGTSGAKRAAFPFMMKAAPTPAPTPNPFFEYLKTAGETPASGGLPWWTSFIKPKAPPTPAPPNPFLELLKEYMSKAKAAGSTSPVVQPNPPTPGPVTTQEVAPSQPTPAPADLWAEFLKTYMSTAGAASGTNPQ
ncbi:hypothetical protein QZH41_016328 [Actinostola sp. cb2023]|nr:hypothetical protein QZH41_016328 [Actinostola sp. cb2023]